MPLPELTTAEAIDHVAKALRDGGTISDAIDGHGTSVYEGAKVIANALDGVAKAIDDAAEAIIKAMG